MQQHVIARPPEQAHEPVSLLPTGTFAPGTGLHVNEGEAALFLRDGMVAGSLGPGRHTLDPNALPFLWNLRDASGQWIQTAIAFVTTAPFAGRWSASEGPARAYGSARYRIADPMLLVRQGGVDPAALLRSGLLEQTTQRGLQRALAEAFAAGWQLPQLAADTGRLAEHARSLASAELAPYGIELLGLDDVTLSSGEPAPAPTPTASTSSSDPVYEMLWDCRHCGTRKLLGVTHRCCPNCGAPQNAAERYFPSDAEKVAVRDHVYYGADRICRYCQNGNGRNSKHCGTCGAPLDEGSDVQRRGDQVHAVGAYAGESAEDARRELSGVAKPQPPAPKKRNWLMIVAAVAGALVLGFIGLIIVAVVWTKPAGLQVAGHEWKREIDVERFGPVEDRDWCDSLPRGATIKGRSRAVRSHEKVQKGEKCATRKRDQGDGTFREIRECEPVYEEKPIYDDECRYTIDKWSKQRTLTASGSALSDAPKWPDVALAKTGQCLGCEREGKRRESYTVRFVDAQSKEASSCSFEEAKWQSFKPGSQWTGEVSVIGGVLNCSSLKPR